MRPLYAQLGRCACAAPGMVRSDVGPITAAAARWAGVRESSVAGTLSREHDAQRELLERAYCCKQSLLALHSHAAATAEQLTRVVAEDRSLGNALQQEVLVFRAHL